MSRLGTGCRSVLLLSVFSFGYAGAAEGLHLTFDRKGASSGAEGVVTGGEQFLYAEEVPAPFMYDPSTGRSTANRFSVKIASPNAAAFLNVPPPTSDMTLELYLKPTSLPTRSTMVLSKLRRKRETGADIGIGIRHLRNFRQSYWGGRLVRQGETKAKEWSTGHYVTDARIRKDRLGWRHLAIVYDASALTLTTYLDHWLSHTEYLDEPLGWDAGLLRLGNVQQPGTGTFEGFVDSVRYTPEALPPAKFLRAVSTPIENIDFSSAATVLPKSSGYIDLKSGFGAVGDGVHDDTAAFQRAFSALANKVPGGYFTLYIPTGEYLVSKMLTCSRFIVVTGAGVDRTLIRLKNRSEEFQDPQAPQPVIRATSSRGRPDEQRRVNGSSIGLYFSDFTLDTGRNNPGAKGMEYHSNNHGTLERVRIRSGDGAGTTALDLTHRTVGPALIKDVELIGFETGVHLAHSEYSMTFEHLRIRGQRKVGILNQQNILAIRGLHSENSVSAVVSEGGRSMLTLLEAKLTDGNSQVPAIVAEGAAYLRDIEAEGYASTLKKRIFRWHGWKENPKFNWEEGPTLTGPISEWWGDHTVAPFGHEQAGSLKLPIEETPVVPIGDPEVDWVSVEAYRDRVTGGDWTGAIQAAIDSGKKSVVLPQGGYTVSGTIRVRGAVQRLHGMRSSLRRPKDSQSNEPLLTIETSNPNQVVLLQHLEINGGLHHRSPATLIIKYGQAGEFRNRPGCGKLFLEGVQNEGWFFDHPQQVWCRQWNPESHADGPVIKSHGATIWSLGFKTEYQSSKIWAFDGARTEILGGFIYPVNKDIPRDRPVFRNVDSDFSGIWGMSVYVANHFLQVDDTQNGKTVQTTVEGGQWAGPRFRMDLYTSRRSSPSAR